MRYCLGSRTTSQTPPAKRDFPIEPTIQAVPRSPVLPWYLALSIAAGLGLLGKTALLAQVLHAPSAATVLLAAVFPFLPLFWRVGIRFRAVLGPISLLTFLAFSLVVFPHMDAVHRLGRGSDQAECVILAANRLATHQWPYVSALMSSRNAMSCGPGWVALQTPAIHWLGYRWDLALCWMLCSAALTARLGWSRTAAILTLTALSGGTWLAAGNGCDFLTFGIALATLAVVLDSSRIAAPAPSGRSDLARWSMALLLSLVVQFRAVTLPVPVFFFRRLGRAAALAAWAFATACQLAFLLWNPDAFVNQGPLHIAGKLMRTAVLSTERTALTIEFLLISLAGLALTTLLARVARRHHPLLLYLAAVFVLPAMQNLVLRYHQFGTVLRAFEFWEGGVWIGACVPLAATLLVRATLPQSTELPAAANPSRIAPRPA